jgi:predicted RNA-binding protein with PUA-like domain
MPSPTQPHWLFKSEPDEFSFSDLKQRPRQTEPWNGVRNYQARNFMRDQMQPGQKILFYHSNTQPPGIVGIATVASKAYPDPSQFDPTSDYYDPKSTPESPRWLLVDVQWHQDFEQQVTLDSLRSQPALADMLILRRGNRLSITPVEPKHFQLICQLGGITPA